MEKRWLWFDDAMIWNTDETEWHWSRNIKIVLMQELGSAFGSRSVPHQSEMSDPDLSEKPVVVETYNWAMEARPGAVDAHNGAVEDRITLKRNWIRTASELKVGSGSGS